MVCINASKFADGLLLPSETKAPDVDEASWLCCQPEPSPTSPSSHDLTAYAMGIEETKHFLLKNAILVRLMQGSRQFGHLTKHMLCQLS